MRCCRQSGARPFGAVVAIALGAALVLASAAPGAAQAVASPHGPLPEGLDCAACHTADGWTPLRSPLGFDHGAAGFPLRDAHEQTTCRTCHLDLRFDAPQARPDDCASCHADVHQGRMAEPCAACHNTRSFQDVDGDGIHARTSFPLTGAHRQVTCASCHVNDVGGAFTSLPTDCVACHQADYEGARSVNHVASGYPTTCTQCHSTLGWSDTPAFDHAAVSGGFALVGAHRGLRCASCHGPDMGLLFQPSGQDDCASCHQGDYDRQHGGSGFPTTCLDCHNVDTWSDATFDHALTGFALEGPHGRVECASCHVDGGGLRFSRPASQDDCVACHKADYDHEHAGTGFPTTCLTCHRRDSWDGASFNHASTGFQLVGAHQPVACVTCHGTPSLAAQVAGPDDCVACHRDAYDGAHAGSSFDTGCVACHKVTSWDDVTVDHAQLANGFALTGPHASAGCAACHSLPDYKLLFPQPAGPDDCVVCHQADYDSEHAGSDFPTTCLTCHVSDSWSGATVDHAALANGFPLVGPHASATCTSCHAVPGYQLLFPTPTDANDCVACHQGEYDANHAGSGFPTTCLSCHVIDTWSGATLDHVSVSGGFALVGSHVVAACAACHTIPGYGLLFPTPAGQNDCVACHQTDYNGAHAGSGFPTDCSACHNANAWKPSSFNHDSQFFPIYSGSHRGKWSSCNDCHTGGVLSTFTCITCHEHSQARMDDKHRGRAGYVYESGACLACHPRGSGD